MELDDLHFDIKFFIGNLSKSNYTTHKIGEVKSLKFKTPKITIIFFCDEKNNNVCIIKFNNIKYSEEDFIKMLKLKSFW